MKTTLGFTLMEIMVVLAVIAVLAAVVFSGFGDARNEAKNRAIMSELKEIQLALEVYKAQYGEYPPVETSAGSCYNTSGAIHTAQNSSGTCRNYMYIAGLAPEFISDLPESRDSGNSNCSVEYQVEGSDHSRYKLTADRCITESTEITHANEFARCPDTCGSCADLGSSYSDSEAFLESIAVYSSLAECL